MKNRSFIILVSIALMSTAGIDNILYEAKGTVAFISDAPLETIKAQTSKLSGLMDIEKKTFAFSLPVSTFQGFNSPLQREHFNEYYLESVKYPNITFKGNMIGFKDCESCTSKIYVKGQLKIHGISQMTTIPVMLSQKGNTFIATATMDVDLGDYDISIPKILQAKISPTINIEIQANFSKLID